VAFPLAFDHSSLDQRKALEPRAAERYGTISGTTDEAKGRVKEAVGVVTDNHRLKVEGRRDQAVGKIKKAVERVIDKAKK
jgi:uncharacterized protein YjbJ (UPF0337 family)